MASGFHPKITASALAGALMSILMGEANRRGLTLSPDEAAGLTVILSFVAGYFVSSNGADDAPAPVAPVVVAAPVVAPPPPVARPAPPVQAQAAVPPMGAAPLPPPGG